MTWNLEGKWSSHHLDLLAAQECDVWLLTEVPHAASLPGMTAHRTKDAMRPGKTWAAVFSNRRMTELPDPHFATAMASIDGHRFMSSVLPWRTCGSGWPGSSTAEKQAATLGDLRECVDDSTVWGGDWNQALEGVEHVGTLSGREQILELLHASRLSVPTRALSSASEGHRSIDHIAVPLTWEVSGANRVRAGRGLSDHDAYVVAISAAFQSPGD